MQKYNFTLIIPTHNRHKYLARSIEYFGSLAADVIYCDSSSIPYEGALDANMRYLHLPSCIFADKILIALGYVTTNFVALCADDDFIILNALYKSSNILNESDSIRTVLGFSIAFHENFDGRYYFKNDPVEREINHDPIMNSKIFFNNYQQVLWGMYDKSIVEKTFIVIKQAKFGNDNFIELVLGGIACYSGGIKILKDVWSVRELSAQEHWGDKCVSIEKEYFDNRNNYDFTQFQINLDKLSCKGFSEVVLKNYINLTIISKTKSIIKSILKRALKKILLRKWPTRAETIKYRNSQEKYPGLIEFHPSGSDISRLNQVGKTIRLHSE